MIFIRPPLLWGLLIICVGSLSQTKLPFASMRVHTGHSESLPVRTEAVPMYKLVELEVLPNCENNHPAAINAQGQVTGICYWANDRNRSYVWTKGALRDLGSLGNKQCDAQSLNDAGQIVGMSPLSIGGSHAFLWQRGHITDLGTLGGRNSFACSINNKGHILGDAETANGKAQPVLWDKNGVHDLSALIPSGSRLVAINDQEQIVGWTRTSTATVGFLLDHGKLTRIAPMKTRYCLVNGINAQGDIVGLYEAGSYTRAFLWRHGNTTDLGMLHGGNSSSARGINNKGQIVGIAFTNKDVGHAFLWQNGKMLDLNEHITEGSAWRLECAVSINDTGEIVGIGWHKDKLTGFLLIPTRAENQQLPMFPTSASLWKSVSWERIGF